MSDRQTGDGGIQEYRKLFLEGNVSSVGEAHFLQRTDEGFENITADTKLALDAVGVSHHQLSHPHQEIVERRLSLYKALNLVHFQEETSELEMARYSFIRDNMVDKIEQKNKKNGMWSDGTIQ
jgi:hypothetical protein